MRRTKPPGMLLSIVRPDVARLRGQQRTELPDQGGENATNEPNSPDEIAPNEPNFWVVDGFPPNELNFEGRRQIPAERTQFRRRLSAMNSGIACSSEVSAPFFAKRTHLSSKAKALINLRGDSRSVAGSEVASDCEAMTTNELARRGVWDCQKCAERD
jgi:hypothetical protein